MRYLRVLSRPHLRRFGSLAIGASDQGVLCRLSLLACYSTAAQTTLLELQPPAQHVDHHFLPGIQRRDETLNMSGPQEGYAPQGYPQQDPYGAPQYGEQPQQQGLNSAASPPPPSGEHPLDSHGRKKKRGYAAQAYDFGAGANSNVAAPIAPAAATGLQPGQTPSYGYAADSPSGYGAPSPYVASAPYGTQAGTPVAGQPVYGQPAPAGVGGYQPPQQGYTTAGLPPQDGVGGITQAIGQMEFGSGGQRPIPGLVPGAAPKIALNQLYPTDLLNQPFNVAELDLPPPPIILPPNVSNSYDFLEHELIPELVKRYSLGIRQLPF